MALLAATLVFAPVTRGSQSWLFGGRLQPSEMAKLGLILALARYFHRNPPGEMRHAARPDAPGPADRRDAGGPDRRCSATWVWRC